MTAPSNAARARTQRQRTKGADESCAPVDPGIRPVYYGRSRGRACDRVGRSYSLVDECTDEWVQSPVAVMRCYSRGKWCAYRGEVAN